MTKNLRPTLQCTGCRKSIFIDYGNYGQLSIIIVLNIRK